MPQQMAAIAELGAGMISARTKATRQNHASGVQQSWRARSAGWRIISNHQLATLARKPLTILPFLNPLARTAGSGQSD